MLFKRIKDPTLWIKAEEEFHRWIENPADYQQNEYADLRKSIHIYFRKKFQKVLAGYASTIYDELPIQTLLAEERRGEDHYGRVKFEPIHEEKVIYEKETAYEEEPEYQPRFRITSVAESNKIIIDGICEGEPDTLQKFYLETFPGVAWLILKNNGTIEDAKDIFQDAMVILIEKYTWDNPDLSCSVGTYVYSICRNLWYGHLRKQKKEKKFIDLERYYTVNISTDYYKEKEPDFFEQVSQAMESLGDKCKKLLELYYFGNHSWKDIASCLGYRSAASARNQKYKCLERIKTRLNGKY
jgi:RNA polymerase sigma factor (sigma-70 family)